MSKEQTTVIENDIVYISADALAELLDNILTNLDNEYREVAGTEDEEAVVRGIQEVEGIVAYVKRFEDMSRFVNGEVINND